MRNQYGGRCYRCGLWVEEGTGYFEKVPGADWRVQHCYTTEVGGRDRKKGVTCDLARFNSLAALDASSPASLKKEV